MPPPGWYPGAPQPPRRERRTWLIVVGVVVPVLALIGAGIVFLRSEDPHALADRDAAEKALLTNHDVGGTFTETDHRAFSRARGGLHVAGGLAGCTSTNRALERDGQALVESVIQSRTVLAMEIVGLEIVAMSSPASAATFVDTIASTVRECVVATVESGARAGGVSISVEPASVPDIGDRVAAFHGSMGVRGSQIAGDVDILVVQKGRAAVLVIAVDTTGSLHGPRLTSLVNKVLIRLAPRFGP
jgi:hypothetical protein